MVVDVALLERSKAFSRYLQLLVGAIKLRGRKIMLYSRMMP
jgi:hypothetical protein